MTAPGAVYWAELDMVEPTLPLRISIHVKPGSSRDTVGGRHGDALVVAVTASAVDGSATEAALVSVAKSVGLRRREVSLRTGAISRAKVVELDAKGPARQAVEARIAELLELSE